MIKFFLDNFQILATHLSQYGETKVLEMKIDLVPGAIPYKYRVRPLNQKDNLQQEDETKSNGTFSESLSVAIGTCKEEGWEVKVGHSTDLRELNMQTVKDSYPLTNIQDILHSLQGATVFSSLDACGVERAQHLSAPLSHFNT